ASTSAPSSRGQNDSFEMRNSRNSGSGVRSNALWGSATGKRDNALWGRRGRGIVLTALADCTLLLPLAAGAKDGRQSNLTETFVAPGLLDTAAKDPGR